MGEVTVRLQPHLVYAAGLLQAWRIICIPILMSCLPLVGCGQVMSPRRPVWVAVKMRVKQAAKTDAAQ